MGIKNFLKNLILEDVSIKSRIYNDVYIDCNYMIHYLIYNCMNNEDLAEKVNVWIRYFMKNVEITNCVHLIFDGSHESKLELDDGTEEICDPKSNTHELRYKNKKVSDAYDKQTIKPKSEIILSFTKYMLKSVMDFKKSYKKTFEILLNNDYNDGEADFKILESIVKNYKKDSSICIVSKDSDMVLISCSVISKYKITIDIGSSVKPLKFISCNIIENFMNVDYVLFMLLLGNDYLPKLSNVKYETLINTYTIYRLNEYEPICRLEGLNYVVDHDLFLTFLTIFMITQKIKFNMKNIDRYRFKIYYNNLLWCLDKYNVTNYKYKYVQDSNKVVNICNFIFPV